MKVVIIDEFTEGQWKVEDFPKVCIKQLTRENVEALPENQTLASVTFQNYFRQYPKLAGMTGTAITEAGNLKKLWSSSN